MSSTEFFEGLGNFFTESFAILRLGGNTVNWIFIVAITIALVVWMFMQGKYNSAEMKESGKLK